MSYLDRNMEVSDSLTQSQKLRINNKRVLTVTTFLFGAFVIAEILGALVSGSLSLLGDASAMSVDVFSYICNLYAEHVKEQDGILSRNTRVIIEVIIPSFSVLALLAVTAYITSDAIATISHPQSGDNGNLIIFMYAFASGNMLVDIISILMFYLRGKSGFLSAFRHINNEEDDSKSTPSENIMITSNLNMVSALTHLGSDSLRTSAVFIAAVLSSIFHLNPDHCDAWAALVVSFTIAMACVPLCREICIARRECREGEYLRLVEV